LGVAYIGALTLLNFYSKFLEIETLKYFSHKFPQIAPPRKMRNMGFRIMREYIRQKAGVIIVKD